MLKIRHLLDHIDARLARHGNLGRTLVKTFAGTAGIKLAHGLLGFATSIVLARLLAPSGYGTYSFVMALVAFLTIPSELGIPGLAIREVATANARQDWGYMRGFIVRAHQLIAVISLLLITLALIAISVWGHGLDPLRMKCMLLGLLLVPMVSLGSLRESMLRGLRKVLLGQLPQQIIRPLTLLTLVLVLPLLGKDLASPVSVMAVQVIAATTAFAVGVRLFLKNRPPDLSTAAPRYMTRYWLTSSVPFGLSAAMQLINGRTDVIALGYFHEDADVGIYRVAVQLAAMVIFGLQSVNIIQGPHIAHLYSTGDMTRLQKMVTRSSQGVMAIAIPVVLIFILFGKLIIRIAFGAEYEGAYPPLIILCVGQLINASMGSVGYLLNMTGHERDTTRSIFIGVIVNLVLNLTLTPLWGMNGTAVATAVTLITWNLIMWKKVRVRLGIEPSPFFRRQR
jgi:O-antigen/teichoic acid export membrane protein